MRIYLLIALALLPTAADATNRFIRQDVGRMDRHYEYECIKEHRDNNYEELRACIKEKKGTAFITIDKFWEEDPTKRMLKVQ